MTLILPLNFWTYESLTQYLTISLIFLFTFALLDVLHNLYYHPLSKYPGPKRFAATRVFNDYYALRGTRIYKVTELHNKYGSVIRLAPNELSYIDERAWKDIYGVQKGGVKAQLSKKSKQTATLFTNGEDDYHARLRKPLAAGFSEKEIREKEPVLQKYMSLLIEKLWSKVSEPIDLIWWMNCAAADTMAHLVYGHPFNGLATQAMPQVIEKANESLYNMAILIIWSNYWPYRAWRGAVNWFLPDDIDNLRVFFGNLVGLNMQIREERLQEGKEKEFEFTDFVSFLTRELSTGTPLTPEEVGSVVCDLMIAGADTIATSLSGTFFLLLTNHLKLQVLTDEIRSTFPIEDDITVTSIQNLKYLNAVISESLRLFPAGPETTRRYTNAGGNTILGELIPKGTAVGVYHYAAGHSISSWRDAESFVPERWLDDPKYKNDNRGVISPFQYGPRNCVGQNLALAQMRLFLARLLWNFDIELCKESKNWWGMRAWALNYDKPPLLVRLNAVARHD
ncbi:cytochrome P450 [Tricladium varicosporioides]|nr:cytochrome P450 [Hymenoscyphus varicosporioides]